MSGLLRKIGLYLRTVRYLKWEQLWRRVAFRYFPRRAGRRDLPSAAAMLRLRTAFPEGYACFAPPGRFAFLNDAHDFSDWNDPRRNKLWLYNLHYFDLLRQPGLPEADARRWIGRWIAENPPFAGNGWEPYPVSLRIVNWIKWALSGHELDAAAAASLALQARHLMLRMERHLLANHLLANAKALVFAGSFFSGQEAEKWLAAGVETYREQLPEQILADGGHFERSPMYHSIILEDLLDLANIGAPLELAGFIRKMLDFLAAMTGPDGRIARFNDAADGIALPPETLFAYAERLGFSRPAPVGGARDLPDAGYVRLGSGAWTLIADGGAIGPDYQPGHAHADTLSFELWHGPVRLLIDSGVGEYVATPLRRYQRSTAAHNALELDGRDSSEVWGAHRVAARARIVERRFADGAFAAAHDGYAPVIHRRKWRVDAGSVRISDTLTGRGTHRAAWYWHFPPGTTLHAASPGRVGIETAGKRFVLSFPETLKMRISTGRFSPEFGRVWGNPVLVLGGDLSLPAGIETAIEEARS